MDGATMSNTDETRGEGAIDKAKGAVKEGLGKLRGDEGQEAEGKVDKAKGTAKETFADVKDKVDETTDNNSGNR